MAIRVAVNRVCDRCQRPFDGQSVEYGESLPTYERRELKMTLGEEVVFHFHDLCDDCARVVDGLVLKIRLDASLKKKAKDVSTDSEKPTEPADPELKAPLTF